MASGARVVGPSEFEFEFDQFNEALVDVWIDNDGDLAVLDHKVTLVLQQLRMERAA